MRNFDNPFVRLNRFLTAIAITSMLMLAAYAPAPISSRPPGMKEMAEQTDEERAKQQLGQHTLGEVGGVTVDTEPNYQSAESDDVTAKNVVAGSKDRPRVNDKIDALVLRQAEKNFENSKPGGFPWWLAFAVIAGFGAVFGLKQWVAKNVPEMPTVKKAKW